MPFDFLLFDPLNIRDSSLIPSDAPLSDTVNQFIEHQNFRDPTWGTLLRTTPLDMKPGEDWHSWAKRNEKEKFGNVYPLQVGNHLVVCFEFFIIHLPLAAVLQTFSDCATATAIAKAGKVPVMVFGGMATKPAGASCPEGALL